MPVHEKVLPFLKLFECVEWKYDGLGGSVIKWTKGHGNTNDDPSVLVWILDASEKFVVAARAQDYSAPGPFAKWLEEKKVEHDRAVGRLPREMQVGWTPAAVEDGAVPAAKEAVEAGKPVWFYAGLPEDLKEAKEWKAARADCDRLERGALSDKPLAELAAKCLCLRLDLSQDAHREFAEKSLGLKKAPGLALLHPKKPDAKPATWTSATVKATDLVKALKDALGEK